MPIAPGTRLGSYEILALLGAGGMGEVYRAHDSKLHRDVALKVLPALVADDPDRLARFRREAQVLASLNHPHIAQIHGFEDSPSTGSGHSGVTHALVMELVEGPTLADRIAQGPVPLAEALAIARQIATALEAAHESGIVHRDLKPANIKVKDDGTVKVLDFGLAKALDPSATSQADAMNSPTLTARATQLGVILGTAAYMSPEQAKGRTVDKRADIWAFGVVLLEMLTGQRAFKGDDASDVLAAVLRQEIDWTALPRDTPPEIRRVLRRCLERDPKRRLRDIGDAFLELDAPIESAPAATVVQPVRRSPLARALPWIAAGLVAAGSVGWTLLRTPPAPPRVVTRGQMSLKEPAILVNLSRDGTRLVYNAIGGPNATSLALRMMDQFEGRPIPGAEAAAAAIFSPDGQWLAYNTLEEPRKIRRIPVTGGTSIAVCDGDFFAGGAWGDDDTIVFSSAKGLMRVAAGGGTAEALTTVNAAAQEIAHVRPQFLPSGRELLLTVMTRESAQFAVLDLATRQYRTIAKGGDNGRYMPSGHLTYVRGGTLFAVPFDLRPHAVIGTEVPVIEGVSTNGPVGTANYTVSNAGLLVYVGSDGSSQGTTLAWADRKGATQILPGQPRQRWGTGRPSPDGRRVANAIDDGKGGQDIWILDVERGTPTRVTFGGVNDYPIWTPDGRRVIYASSRDGKSGLWSVPADASGKPEELFASEGQPQPSSITPDGKTLLFHRTDANRTRRIFTRPLSTSRPAAEARPLHEASASEWNAQVSPDGRWVAYESTDSGSAELYVQPFPGPGPKVRISAQGAVRARWSHDGRELYYWMNAPSSRLMAVDVPAGETLNVGAPREVFTLLSGTTWGPTPGRDRFLVELVTTDDRNTISMVTDWFEELRRRAPAKK